MVGEDARPERARQRDRLAQRQHQVGFLAFEP
jgi:hypothetical protein